MGTIAAMLLSVGLIALVFAGYFLFSSDRIANRNVLDRRVEILSQLHRRRPPRRRDPMEELLNRVFVIDERLVRMKVAMAIVLLMAGLFLLLVSCTLLMR